MTYEEPARFSGVVMIEAHQTWFLDVDGDEVWLSKKLIDWIDEPRKGHEAEFEIPTWYAEKKELI